MGSGVGVPGGRVTLDSKTEFGEQVESSRPRCHIQCLSQMHLSRSLRLVWSVRDQLSESTFKFSFSIAPWCPLLSEVCPPANHRALATVCWQN